MNLVKKLSFSVIRRVPLNMLLQVAPNTCLIPFQHVVSDEALPWMSALYRFKTLRQFETDIDFLLSRFTPLSLTDLIRASETGSPLAQNSFLLTFDDAFRQVYEVIMPVLLRKGLPAALFIVPDFLDNKSLFYDLKKGLILDNLGRKAPSAPIRTALAKLLGIRDAGTQAIMQGVRNINYLNRKLPDRLADLLELDFDTFLAHTQPFMTSAMVHDFIKKGFHVGGHSMDHPLYNLVSVQEQVHQTLSSVKWVREAFGLSYKAFAFPHTDKGLGTGLFTALETCAPELRPDILFGNTTGMLEKNPRVYHRFIGENPDLDMQTMVKAVLFYRAAQRAAGNEYIKRY